MSFIHSFPPIETPTARVLVLGTMPGKVSLRERQYYAHPRNGFWSIMGSILGFDPASPYPARVAMVQGAQFAVWDVLKSCTRTSSLDSDIDTSSLVLNDFAGFFEGHPHVRRVCFNGATAEMLFQKRVAPLLALDPGVDFVRLPSTSPANASLALSAKLKAWRAIAP